ncbi:hypothetical protein GCM10007071_23770 [Marinobacter zhanjiangensis]|uniref:Uncharacterized protein n=1 Tax=Marinobacter zhanjiangensis TaxID=578215 RepID=A0ABQ3B6K6_9GAMM|nr:hypothetical protein GCM10007071_23770 [Marinobacter zhanjiangensis]
MSGAFQHNNLLARPGQLTGYRQPHHAGADHHGIDFQGFQNISFLVCLNTSFSTVRARHAPQAKARLAGKGGSLAKRRNTGLRGMADSRRASLCERWAVLHSLELAHQSCTRAPCPTFTQAR